MAGKTQYRTEDGVTLETGDAAYDYENMKPGVIGEDAGGVGVNEGWFEFVHSDGMTDLLNGQRICSVDYARRRKFKNA
jgi:hypothetical protein